MIDGWFATRLQRALDTLDREYPALYRRMADAMESRRVLLDVDGEAVGICFASDGGPLQLGIRDPNVRCATTSATIIELAEGESSLEEAILGDAILLQGGVEDLLSFHSALMAFLHGAVRSPTFPEHLASFKRDSARRPKSTPRLPSPKD